MSVFAIYLVVTIIYAAIYYHVYSYDPTYFAFNSEVKGKKIETEYTYWRTLLNKYALPHFRGLKNDTVRTKNSIKILIPQLTMPLAFGNDTIFIRDTAQFSTYASDIVNNYEKHNSVLWNQFDFLYFSVITISTVGYGDILPNSTTIRMIVVSEIIIGQLILIVFLNYVIINIRTKLKNEDNNQVAA